MKTNCVRKPMKQYFPIALSGTLLCLTGCSSPTKVTDLAPDRTPGTVHSSPHALLILVDGSPKLQKMPGLEVERVANSRALILKSEILRNSYALDYYLYVSQNWYWASAVRGPWTPVASAPPEIQRAKEDAVAGGDVDLMPGPASAATTPPTILVSTVPVALLETEGLPAKQ
jgi:hypothetical protein